MAGKALETSKSTSHQRTVSLPSSGHPLTTSVEEQLARLQSSDAASTSAASICQKLGGLQGLYESVDDWLQLSHTREVLSNRSHRSSVEDLLDGSVRTLDVCETIRRVLSETKESLRELESSLRRTSAGEIDGYLASRKKTKKLISKSMERLRKAEKQNPETLDSPEESALSILREVETMSVSVFESLMSFLSRSRGRSNGWDFVSRVLSSKRISCNDGAGEVERLENELLALRSGKESGVNGLQKRVAELESSVSEIEEVTESVFRCLVKGRVSLLNCLNH